MLVFNYDQDLPEKISEANHDYTNWQSAQTSFKKKFA